MADGRPLALQRDPMGEKILSGTFDWRDERIVAYIKKFVEFGLKDSRGNVRRQKSIRSGALLRSVAWKTWSQSGGDVQVFHAHFLYYSKFVELALGKGNPFRQLPPNIPGRQWQPIPMPDRSRKARPSIPTEMRKRARRFVTFAEDYFSYAGIAMMVYAMRGDDPNAAAINRSLFLHGLTGRENRYAR